jgi:hypothetical protein
MQFSGRELAQHVQGPGVNLNKRKREGGRENRKGKKEGRE